jgi:hypothetical protein
VGAPFSLATAQTATDATLAELRGLVERQQALLEEQSRILEARGHDIEALRARLDAMALTARSDGAAPRGAPAEGTTAPTEPASATAEGAQEPQRTPEMPAPVVSAGDFPGSLRIPGTDTALRIGGQARMTLVNTFGPLGTDDRFVTSSIPVEGEQVPGEASRTNYSPAASRTNLDVRSHTPIGPMRTFLESDFAGSGRTMRLRHAFIQTNRWVFGQTWSTFSDPEAEPIGIDFEGLNAISLFRQPLVRYTHPLGGRMNLAFALENPAPDLSGAQGVNFTPDFIARLRWDPEYAKGAALRLTRTAHVQAAILVRQLRGELTDQPAATLSTGGFGVNVSGVLVPRWDADDRVKFASNAGWGIGRYITDLGTLGGQDAVYDATSNQLRALPVSSAYVGYERLWKSTFASAVTYGIVNVENLDIQPDTALRRTQRATINLTWTPIPQFDLVLEFLGGTRVNKDGRRGTSSQLQAGWTFRF